jgi:hypothetical protein
MKWPEECLAALGHAATAFIAGLVPETKGKSLENLEKQLSPP